ncbi:COBRA-like protein 5 [Camellia lanceoleosa]|uniref:COBRA-like protein 5 n=1 Tax=Camellia lanceoleosa TaxID=1840588 RepID=A0ACC0GJH8_9ERIC|nr:COBRA-like protein 5 [Camellia lanceoleosa]
MRFVISVLFLVFISCGVAYDPLDLNGNITIRWDVMSWTLDSYVVAAASIKLYVAITDGTLNLVDKFLRCNSMMLLGHLKFIRRHGIRLLQLRKPKDFTHFLGLGANVALIFSG